MFTWSFGCAPSPARFAITSLAFMFDEVPEPVWKTSIGNWSSCLPSATAVPGRGDPLGDVVVELAQRAVGFRRGGLDPAQPAHHRHRHALAGDGEVVDCLGGLATPELLARGGLCVNAQVAASVKFWGGEAYCAGTPGRSPSPCALRGARRNGGRGGASRRSRGRRSWSGGRRPWDPAGRACGAADALPRG